MAFHPNYWTKPVSNGSEQFNYYQYNSVGRKEAVKHIKADTGSNPVHENQWTSRIRSGLFVRRRLNPVFWRADAFDCAKYVRVNAI